MSDFSGNIVAITGAAQGLGAAMAARFLKDGAEGVALLDMNQNGLEATRKLLDPDGARTMTLICDVADSNSVAEAFEKINERFGKIDILVNNAGITRDAMAQKMTVEQFDSVVKVSLYGSFNCAHQVIPGMRSRGYGRIISLSSLASEGNIGQANYSAAKAGMIGMTKTLSLELGPKNITVNCVAPGMINTEMIKTVPSDVLDNFVNSIPLRRLGEPEEVASLVAFLASDEAAYISGQCITISGGKR